MALRRRTPAELAATRRLLFKRQVVGLLIIAVALLVFIVLRAHWSDLFPAGWWRL